MPRSRFAQLILSRSLRSLMTWVFLDELLRSTHAENWNAECCTCPCARQVYTTKPKMSRREGQAILNGRTIMRNDYRGCHRSSQWFLPTFPEVRKRCQEPFLQARTQCVPSPRSTTAPPPSNRGGASRSEERKVG